MKKKVLILLILIVIFLVGCKKSDNISGGFVNIPKIFPDFSGVFNYLTSCSSVRIVNYDGGTCREYYDCGDKKNTAGYLTSTKNNGQSLESTDVCIGDELRERYCDSSSSDGYKIKNYNCGQNKCKTQTESGTGRVMGYCEN